MTRLRDKTASSFEPAAGNGLLDRRLLLKSGAVFAGAMTPHQATAANPLPASRPFQQELLRLAFAAASAFPATPHGRTVSSSLVLPL